MFITLDHGRARYTRLLQGRSARVVISTGDAALAYRWLSGAHSLKLMRRNILGMAGIGPVRSTIVGGASSMSPAKVAHWRERLRRLGERAA
jgi:putative NADPH-quinone reductase